MNAFYHNKIVCITAELLFIAIVSELSTPCCRYHFIFHDKAYGTSQVNFMNSLREYIDLIHIHVFFFQDDKGKGRTGGSRAKLI